MLQARSEALSFQPVNEPLTSVVVDCSAWHCQVRVGANLIKVRDLAKARKVAPQYTPHACQC